MSEKTPVNSKRIILLRLILPCLMIAVLLFPVLAVPARAELIDYNDYVYKVQVDGDNDLVYVKIPADMAFVRIFDVENNYSTIYSGTGAHHDIYFEKDKEYRIYVDVMGYRDGMNGLDLQYIPVGTTIASGFSLDDHGDWDVMSSPNPQVEYYYYNNSDIRYIYADVYQPSGWTSSWDFFAHSYALKDIDDAYRLAISYFLQPVEFIGDTPWSGLTVNDTTLVFSISSLLRQQQLTGKTNALLKEVEKQLAEQGKTLEDIKASIDETNDKLDELPGEIGDEIQGVINNEKQEAQSSGNKFVDQLLDLLPDPSTGVLSALRGLTDATSYTGTQAVLTIPAIVIPGIDGLFPTTEIWGGAQFDFGEYVDMLPSSLLTLVQSLFTIAIVLFCVYELKGIISYCLTLRANKGG